MLEALQVLAEYQGFFRDYRPTFTANFRKICVVLDMDPGPGELVEPLVAELYLRLFPMAAGATPRELDLDLDLSPLVARAVDVRLVLGKGFMLLVKDFVNHLFTRCNELAHLRVLVGLLEDYLVLIEHRYGRDEEAGLPADPVAELLAHFDRFAAERRELSLFNLHKGVPISYSATVAMRRDGEVMLRVHPTQAVVLKLQRKTYLRGEGLPGLLRAKVVGVDLDNEVAVLSDFVPSESALDKRRFLRVQPKDPLAVTLTSEEGELDGRVADVSLSGMGVLVMETAWLRPELPVLVRLQLPLGSGGRARTVTLHGKVLKVMGKRAPYLAGLAVHADSQTEVLVSQYLAQRQSEVVREVQDRLSVLARELG